MSRYCKIVYVEADARTPEEAEQLIKTAMHPVLKRRGIAAVDLSGTLYRDPAVESA